jgi:hypothetical protein
MRRSRHPSRRRRHRVCPYWRTSGSAYRDASKKSVGAVHCPTDPDDRSPKAAASQARLARRPPPLGLLSNSDAGARPRRGQRDAASQQQGPWHTPRPRKRHSGAMLRGRHLVPFVSLRRMRFDPVSAPRTGLRASPAFTRRLRSKEQAHRLRNQRLRPMSGCRWDVRRPRRRASRGQNVPMVDPNETGCPVGESVTPTQWSSLGRSAGSATERKPEVRPVAGACRFV